MKIINDRYEVIELLHKDNSFIEYLVSDRKKNHAVKRIRIIDTEMSNYDFIRHMEEQFVEISTLVHEHLLCAYEFQAIMTIDGNYINRKQYCYTYEHYDEESLVSYLELTKSEINTVIMQLCKIIRFLHFRGFTYKFLNFDQVIILKKNGMITLKLKDVAGNYINDYYFKMDHEKFSQFIAPEIIWGEEVDKRVDLYSLGSMIYYLYYRIDYKTNVLENAIKISTGNEIHKFIMKAANHIREERYETINKFIEVLSNLIWIEVDHDDAKYYDKIHENTKIIGRDSLIKEIKGLVDAKSKKSLSETAMFIQGDVGTGKSRLLNEVYYIAKFSRFNYVYLRPNDFSEPFYMLKTIVKYIAEQEDLSPMLIQKYGYELTCLVPELASKWNLKEVKELDLDAHFLRIINRVFNFFVDYTNSKFLMILVDDFEKLSHYEHAFFKLLIDNKLKSNYYIVCTGVEHENVITQCSDSCRHFKLTSLNLEETGQLIRTSLGLDYIPYKLTHRLMLENQGKPSVTKRMIRKLWAENIIFFDKNKMTWNLDKVDDSFTFDYMSHKSEDFDSLTSQIKKEYYEILRKLSVLKGSFNMQIIFELAEIEEEFGYYFLYDMEEKQILNKRISDVEYVFVFYSNELRTAFLETLTPDEIIDLSKRAADIFDRRYTEKRDINESLIDYLVASNNIRKAAEYCITFAKDYIDMKNSHKAISLYEQGLEIYKKLENIEQINEISFELVKQLILVGKLDRSAEILDHLDVYIEGKSISKVRSMVYHIEILMFKNDIERAEMLADRAIELAEDISYVEGIFNAALYKCNCLSSKNDWKQHFSKASFYLSESIRLNQTRHRANFENECAINYLYSNLFKQAIEMLGESLKHYREAEDEDGIIKVYNNYGVVYLDGLGEFVTARDFFRKSYTRSNQKNSFVKLPIYLNNIGETYRIESRYEMAIKYFTESYELAETVGDKTMTILALMNLAHSYLLNEDYSDVYKLLTRIEHEVQMFEKRGFDKFDYYLLHFEFFLTMNSLMKINQLKYEFTNEDIIDEFRRYRLSIVENRIRFKKNTILMGNKENGISNKLVQVDEIKELLSRTQNPSHAKLLRELIVEYVIDCIEERDFFSAQELVDIDDKLIRLYNTKLIRIKRDFIDACLSDYAIERITSLVPQIKEQSKELLWRTYYVLGNEYNEKKNYYDALKYYLMALDVIETLASTIPFEYKETYVLHDDIKLALKSKTDKIIKLLLTFEGLKYQHILDNRIDTVEDYFDLTQLRLLYSNKDFLNLVYKNLKTENHYIFDSSTDLIKHLEKEEISNLKMILKYLEQIAVGERAFIYLLDENDHISEVISSKDNAMPYDITRLINNIGNELDGIYVSKIESFTNRQLLTDDQKGLIYFPILETINHSPRGEKRRDDIFASKKNIVGYVYIDSSNVINRFSAETFEQAKSFSNLIYVFINNYNLKKLSTIDKLTGVYLRKYIEQQFALQMSVSRQQAYNLSVIMMDIDKFKTVNDTYGHRKGDEILAQIGDILMKSMRVTDLVGRYGGEEFVMILPETDALGAYKVAEKIRLLIQQKKLLGEESPLTVSLGVSTYPEDGANEEELIEKADQALYYSKNNGRNKATSWDEKLIKEGHRYDRLTGILTGNISSDTRNMQAILDIINQLNYSASKMTNIKNTFISLLDITEGEEIQFLQYDHTGEVTSSYFKKKGQDSVELDHDMSERLLAQYRHTNASHYFIDWDENVTMESDSEEIMMPDWKSYIMMDFEFEQEHGLMAISVPIKIKEFDFSNFNFVESLRPVLTKIFFMKE